MMTNSDTEQGEGLRIIVVDDNQRDIELIAETLQPNFTCTIRAVTTKDALLGEFHIAIPDVVVSDSNVPGCSGLLALKVVSEMFPRVPFVFCSGSDSEELQHQAMWCGATAWVPKADLARLVAVVKKACCVPE
jgi:CheY-like chemotaxis protein